MATANAVWGVEVGQCALKALKLRPAEDGKVELVAFDLIEHPKILSQPDADPDALIHAALEKFISRNDWQGDAFVIGVPGQQTFARFCKLPPVESKKIPEIVRFEASQQIPFDIEDVVWDYQVFQTEDMPDVEVGIFAMRKDLIRKQLDHFGDLGVAPTAIQTIPSALYNFCRFDAERQLEEGTATVIIDVGSQHTDLIVVEPDSAWSRNIPLGGNSFTEALVKAFKLSFAKAENLKRTAATSKYARQIFQAMRPVFADLVAEIQRSIGFYSSTHRDVELENVLACGNAFHLPGLQKYLENNLTIAGGVRKLEKFNALLTSATANAPQFTDNILSFAPAYGLALQGLGLATISASLLPPELARVQLWKRKRPFFVAAAACLAIAAGFPWLRDWTDSQALAANRELGDQAKQIVDRANKYQRDFRAASTDTTAKREKIEKLFELQKDRAVIPRILALVHEAMPEINPPELAAAQTPEEYNQKIKSAPARFKRSERRQMVIEKLDMRFAKDIDALEREGLASRRRSTGPGARRWTGRQPGPPEGMLFERGRMPPGPPLPWAGVEAEDEGEVSDAKAGFYVSLEGRLLYGQQQSEAIKLITEEFYPELRRLGNVPGLGFYIPKEDPKSPDSDQANLRVPSVVPFTSGAGTVVGPRSIGRRLPLPGTPGTTEGDESVANPDPVTGEDMSFDWNFRLGFKIKLGEPPEPESAESQEGE
ncbi:MAG: type IV pilus assembly protein PilM [Phycisphaerae bacterium]